MTKFLFTLFFASVSLCATQEVSAVRVKPVREERDPNKTPQRTVPQKPTTKKAFLVSLPSDHTAEENYNLAMKFRNKSGCAIRATTFLRYAADHQNHGKSALELHKMYSSKSANCLRHELALEYGKRAQELNNDDIF